MPHLTFSLNLHITVIKTYGIHKPCASIHKKLKLLLKILLAFLLTLTVATTSAYYFWYKPKFNHKRENIVVTSETRTTETNTAKLKAKSLSLKAYAKKHNYNTEVGFLIDLTLNSGSNRFFIIDPKTNYFFVINLKNNVLS